MSPWSSGLGLHPFTVATRVRIPLEILDLCNSFVIQYNVDLEKEIKDILFEIGKDIKIHKLIDGNLIVEMDYEKYTAELIALFNKTN